MTISILGARVIDPNSGLDQVSDLHIDAGKIVALGAAPASFTAARTLDAKGLVAAPGLVDLSVALREPGYSRKGSIASETLAAAAGVVVLDAAETESTNTYDGGTHVEKGVLIFGNAASINVGENANGVSVWVTRITGASRWSKA